MRLILAATLFAATLLAGCLNDKGSAGLMTPPPAQNTLAITIDAGPAGATGQINHAYVTVKVCVSGSSSQCANIDHVLLDTGSVGLRLVRSVLNAGSVALSNETDAQGHAIEECVSFGAGQTWGPVALADVSMAGESAIKLPVQIMDDTGSGAPPPATCGANGSLVNGVAGFGANGLLGIGVFVEDCGASCVGANAPLPLYYGCTATGMCTAENVPLTDEVTNPVALFTTDNNGVIILLPDLANPNGDATVQGELIFGVATQSDNALTAGLTVLGTSASGDFTATYNGGTAVLPALIDSGTDSFAFDDPTIAVCASGAFIGYYCPAVSPLNAFAVNSGVGVNNGSNTVNFAIADPNGFVPNADAYAELGGGGGSTHFTWGMPFFYGRKIYIGIDQRVSGAFTGPYYAY